MTNSQYIIGRKMNMLELGQKLGNISEACRRLGVTRQHYYDVRTLVEENGIDGLLEKARNKPRIGNRVNDEIEKTILEYSLEYPTHGQVRVANELRKKGVGVSSGGIRGVWIRHGIEIKKKRLERLEKWAAAEKKILTESQVRALEEVEEEKKAHGEIETSHPGFLLGQDTLYVGYIKGIGKIYQQTGIDTWSNVGFAKVYEDKTALTAADFLNDKVLPFFDEHGLPLLRTLTDRGSEYGYKHQKTEGHPYQLFLELGGVEHSRTKVRHPQTNGATERLNQIVLEEFYQVFLRKKVYASLAEIQADLDEYMEAYNKTRTNQGKRCQGRTPYETFLAGIPLAQKMIFEISESEEKKNLDLRN